MTEEILMLARAVSGAGDAESTLLEPLCQAARQHWESRLCPGLTPEDCREAFVCAAAFTAAADLAAGRGGGAVSAFTAGEVSIKGRGAAESASLARGLRETAERLMAPYAGEENFCFRGVRG